MLNSGDERRSVDSRTGAHHQISRVTKVACSQFQTEEEDGPLHVESLSFEAFADVWSSSGCCVVVTSGGAFGRNTVQR